MNQATQQELCALLDSELSRGNPAAVSSELDFLAKFIASKIDGNVLIDALKTKIIRFALAKGWEAIPPKIDPFAVAALKTAVEWLQSLSKDVTIPRGNRLAVQFNVSKIDPAVYGDDGHLPGVELDRRNWREFLTRQGFSILHDIPNTSKRQFADSIRTLADRAVAGDVVVIQHSGHGSQLRDQNGDESDGQDEVLCLFDGTLVDDVVFGLLATFRPGVHVCLITDTCHSGTMYRSQLIDRITHPRVTGGEVELNCELVAIGTSSDKQTSADTAEGGAGSQALLATFASAKSYADWIVQSQAWLRANRYRQTMSLNTVNADSSSPPLAAAGASATPAPVVAGVGIRSVVVTMADGRVVSL